LYPIQQDNFALYAGRTILRLAPVILTIVLLCYSLPVGAVAANCMSNPSPVLSLQAASFGRAIAPVTGPAEPPLTSPDRFGRITVIAWPLYLTLRFVHAHVIRNWGWAIILLTALFNLLLIGPRVLSMRTSVKMAQLQPEIEAIRKRYPRLNLDATSGAEMNAQIMAVYRREGVNAFGGLLPLLLQMPLLFGLFSVFRNAAELHGAHWMWLTDLARPDPLHILPVLIIAGMTLTQFISPSPGMSVAQRRMIAILTALIFGYGLSHYASGLALYWATGNLVNLLVQLAINQSRLGRSLAAHSPGKARQ
jgi:YidC/Oxa1 family membrane protein insertase